MAGPDDFLPPSFRAASISCLFLSSSSICFFLAWASASFFSCSSLLIFSCSPLGSLLLLLLSTDLLPGGLFVLQPLELCLLLGPLVPPLADVLPQLVVHLGLLLLVFGRRHGDE